MEKEMTREQIAYDSKDLFAGGWRASDRDEFKKEYDLTDWEADVMAEELEKLADQYVEDEDGHMIDYDAAVEMMDDDLREELHREMAPVPTRLSMMPTSRHTLKNSTAKNSKSEKPGRGQQPRHHLKGLPS
jgi:hypothetical protein